LLSAAAGKSKVEVQELLARHQPRPDVPASIRKLPERVSAAVLPLTTGKRTASPTLTAEPSNAAAAVANEAAEPVAPMAPTPQSLSRYRTPVTPLAGDRYQFTFTGDSETRELLDFAKDMLSHSIPKSDTGEVMKRALKALVVDLARKKFAATARPRKEGRAPTDPGDVSAAVKREVWIRDRGRCAYVARDGRRCTERTFVQLHHVAARARGGPGTVENIELRCRGHNDYEAELVFGERRPRGEWDTREARPVYGSATRSGTSSPSGYATPS
jgi:hypothetical protein